MIPEAFLPAYDDPPDRPLGDVASADIVGDGLEEAKADPTWHWPDPGALETGPTDCEMNPNASFN